MQKRTMSSVPQVSRLEKLQSPGCSILLSTPSVPAVMNSPLLQYPCDITVVIYVYALLSCVSFTFPTPLLIEFKVQVIHIYL